MISVTANGHGRGLLQAAPIVQPGHPARGATLLLSRRGSPPSAADRAHAVASRAVWRSCRHPGHQYTPLPFTDAYRRPGRTAALHVRGHAPFDETLAIASSAAGYDQPFDRDRHLLRRRPSPAASARGLCGERERRSALRAHLVRRRTGVEDPLGSWSIRRHRGYGRVCRAGVSAMARVLSGRRSAFTVQGARHLPPACRTRVRV